MTSEARSVDDRQLSQRIADEAWPEATRLQHERALPKRPLSILFAGIPLSGKSTIARTLVKTAPTAVVHVENDALRERAAGILDRQPQHDSFENFVTYQAAWLLAGEALDHGMHAVHDATNLTERGRRKAYALADERDVPVIVVFVLAGRETLDERAKHLPKTRQQAHAKYAGRDPDPTKCSRPAIVLDGALDVEDHLKRLKGNHKLVPVWNPPPRQAQPHE